MADKKVEGYQDSEQQRRKLDFVTYEYELPFNYPNIQVNRRFYHGGEFHGMEMYPLNYDAKEGKAYPPDAIVISEDDPIVRVVVIGSACNPPGYVQIEAEAVESFRRADEIPDVMPVRFRINNLWGMHLRWDQWAAGGEGEPASPLDGKVYPKMPEPLLEQYPGLRNCSVKTDGRENPLAGMSCAIFEIPQSKKVAVMGGCEIPGWAENNHPDDAHYSFRIIRTTVTKGG